MTQPSIAPQELFSAQRQARERHAQCVRAQRGLAEEEEEEEEQEEAASVPGNGRKKRARPDSKQQGTPPAFPNGTLPGLMLQRDLAPEKRLLELLPGALQVAPPQIASPRTQAEWVAACFAMALDPRARTNRSAHPDAELRWATLGDHYDWTGRTYPRDIPRSSFPKELASLVRSIAKTYGLSLTAEAAIINFYPPAGNPRMGFHADDAEFCFDFPILSLSFGAACVFMVAPTDAHEAGSPIASTYLESGDAIVLSGPSRLAKHAVPATLPGTTPPELVAELEAMGGDQQAALEFIRRGGRLNVNVRQVREAPIDALAESTPST